MHRDHIISANLLYLDAIKRGLDQDPDYQAGLRLFADAIDFKKLLLACRNELLQ
jgi:hypothetical protein